MDAAGTANPELDADSVAIAASEALALIPDAVIGTDAAGVILFFGPAAERLFGHSMGEIVGKHVGELLPARFRASHDVLLLEFAGPEGDEQRLMARRSDVCGLRKDGTEFPAEVSVSRRRLGGRTILTAVVRDITDRKRLEQQLRERSARLEESEEHLRLALHSGRLGTWNWEAGSGRLRLDRQARRLVGLENGSPLKLADLLALTIPKDVAGLESALSAAADGEQIEHTFGVRLQDGERRQIALAGAAPRHPDAGRPVFGVAWDVTRTWGKEQQRKTLVRELNHRIGNLMAVVNSVVRLTAPHYRTAEELRDALYERLSAVGERHVLVNQEGYSAVGLDSLLSAELRPYAAPGGANVELRGPSLRVSAEAATSMGLVLHEMATNSAKYGALSSVSGHLVVQWQVDAEAGLLELTWTERCGPPVRPPERTGFGSSLMRRMVVLQFGGDLEARYPPEGFEAALRLPMSKLQEDLA